MYLLYIDESGSADTEYFVVGGLAVHEQDATPLAEAANRAALTLPHPATGAEIHADHIRGGRGPWRQVPKDTRAEFLNRVARLLRRPLPFTKSPPILFAVALHKQDVRHDPYERAYEEFLARCNGLMGRMASSGNAHRCVAISDKSRNEQMLQSLTAVWRTTGASTGAAIGPMRGYAEVPLFVDSAASRCVQLADFVAFAVYRAYQRDDPLLLDQIVDGFDSEDGVMHGLVHWVAQHWKCACRPCRSRHS